MIHQFFLFHRRSPTLSTITQSWTSNGVNGQDLSPPSPPMIAHPLPVHHRLSGHTSTIHAADRYKIICRTPGNAFYRWLFAQKMMRLSRRSPKAANFGILIPVIRCTIEKWCTADLVARSFSALKADLTSTNSRGPEDEWILPAMPRDRDGSCDMFHSQPPRFISLSLLRYTSTLHYAYGRVRINFSSFYSVSSAMTSMSLTGARNCCLSRKS